MKTKYLLFAVLLLTVVLSGCQSTQTTPSTTQQGETQQIVPFSNGPSGPPVVKGPSSMPNGEETKVLQLPPQAVTETEKVKFSIK
jgi:PBP1b-binding outer membrane lipoprotein LpoB